jgi:hypothetical protein
MLFSPATIVVWNEIDDFNLERAFGEGGVWLPYMLNFVAYGTALVVFRSLALRHADRWLGRAEGEKVHREVAPGQFPTLRGWLGSMEGIAGDPRNDGVSGWAAKDAAEGTETGG